MAGNWKSTTAKTKRLGESTRNSLVEGKGNPVTIGAAVKEVRIDVDAVVRAIKFYPLGEIASFLGCTRRELREAALARGIRLPRSRPRRVSRQVKQAPPENVTFELRRCPHGACNGNLYVDDGEVKCLSCGRTPRREQLLIGA